MKPKSFAALALLAISACTTTSVPDAVVINSPQPQPSAAIRAASFITHDLDASIAFYVNFLGYKQLGVSTVDAEKSRRVVGTLQSGTVRYAALAPASWSKDSPNFAGVSFVEIPWSERVANVDDPDRASRAGDVILAHRVVNIVEIEKRMRASNVPFVADLGLSGSGKSKSMAVLDPNGTRVEMYEY